MKPFREAEEKVTPPKRKVHSLSHQFFVFFFASQAGRDESSHVDESQAVIDAKAGVPPL